MNICVVTPAPHGSRSGNRVTAERWTRILRELRHDVALRTNYGSARCGLLIALHARKSAADIERFARDRPGAPIVVALTGTDLYGDIRSNPAALRSLTRADFLVTLQPKGIDELPRRVKNKVRVIRQSADPVTPRPAPLRRRFDVAVLGHLRTVKDPFRAAYAVRRLPDTSCIRVLQMGRAMSAAMERRARHEDTSNPRYRWLGDRPRGDALRTLARSRVLVLSSRSEGGANVVSEAVVNGVPVISSRIPGSVGLLGEDYPGYFDVGDTKGLRDLLLRTESDPAFHAGLRRRCRDIAPLFRRSRERACWRALLREAAANR